MGGVGFDESSACEPAAYETILGKGIAAAKDGDRETAREFLTEAAELNAFGEDAWMWLASISEYPEELVAFLTNVLTINPENEQAKKWLADTEAMLGKAIVDHKLDVACPFCSAGNDASVFECASCHAAVSLSDIEAILSNTQANRETIQNAVIKMEAEWNLREFDERELTMLGIGHLNLRSYDEGLKYLNEALRLAPNNVILSGQINTIAIRRDEMRRQNEMHDGMIKGKTVLVVDDSATVRKLISSKLEKAGHNVACAVDGVEALAMITENLPDMVFLDISMPRMDGYEVCKQIRANPASKHLPVVMISGKDGFFDKVRGRMAGTTDYITKPFGPDTLMKAIETHLVAETAAV